MKRQYLFKAVILALAFTFNACDKGDDLLHGLDKVSYRAYLHNESGQDVTVLIRPGTGLVYEPYFVPKGAEVEIPDTELWGLQQRVYASDSVIFEFADGKRVTHCYVNMNYYQNPRVDSIVYIPTVNNIFFTGIEVSEGMRTWKESKIQAKKHRYDYFIK